MYPIVGYIGDDRDVSSWTNDGRFIHLKDDALDLVNTKAQHERWVNIWKWDDGRIRFSKSRRFYLSRSDAELYAGGEDAIQAKLTWEE